MENTYDGRKNHIYYLGTQKKKWPESPKNLNSIYRTFDLGTPIYYCGTYISTLTSDHLAGVAKTDIN